MARSETFAILYVTKDPHYGRPLAVLEFDGLKYTTTDPNVTYQLSWAWRLISYHGWRTNGKWRKTENPVAQEVGQCQCHCYPGLKIGLIRRENKCQ